VSDVTRTLELFKATTMQPVQKNAMISWGIEVCLHMTIYLLKLYDYNYVHAYPPPPF
jgi:hypothetical protein